MMAFLFWDSKHTRTNFILLSISSGFVTLLPKAHYTIDVLAAPFVSVVLAELRVPSSDHSFAPGVRNGFIWEVAI